MTNLQVDRRPTLGATVRRVVVEIIVVYKPAHLVLLLGLSTCANGHGVPFVNDPSAAAVGELSTRGVRADTSSCPILVALVLNRPVTPIVANTKRCSGVGMGSGWQVVVW